MVGANYDPATRLADGGECPPTDRICREEIAGSHSPHWLSTMVKSILSPADTASDGKQVDAQGSNRPALALWALQFLGGLAAAPVYALLAVYVESSLHQPPLYTAFLRSIPLAVGGLASPAAGALADRMGYKPAY